ncbi:MAG: ATP-binding protein [Spirochaetales bacterium]|nr:ATP-binding protein [Spirochaetales bacterium]
MNIAVSSGKGGTGKTLVSTSLALSYTGSTYIDMDVEEPNGAIFINPEIQKTIRFTVPIPEFNENTCTFCGKCAEACVYNAISVIPQAKKILFFNELCHNCGVCKFVCPVQGTIVEKPKSIGTINIGNSNHFIEGILDIGIPSAVPLISGMKKYFSGKGITIIDSPPGTSCPVVETVKDSDFVILVTEPTPFGLNDLELALEVIRDLGKPHGIVVNKHDKNNTSARKFAEKRGVKILLEIPFSRKIAEGYSQGIPLINSKPEYRDIFKKLIEKISAGTV